MDSCEAPARFTGGAANTSGSSFWAPAPLRTVALSVKGAGLETSKDPQRFQGVPFEPLCVSFAAMNGQPTKSTLRLTTHVHRSAWVPASTPHPTYRGKRRIVLLHFLDSRGRAWMLLLTCQVERFANDSLTNGPLFLLFIGEQGEKRTLDYRKTATLNGAAFRDANAIRPTRMAGHAKRTDPAEQLSLLRTLLGLAEPIVE